MSRTFILAAGTILWAVVAVVAVVHVLNGTWTSAAMMALLGVAWITLRLAPWSPLRIRPRAGAISR
jgi:hypothetical protein